MGESKVLVIKHEPLRMHLVCLGASNNCFYNTSTSQVSTKFPVFNI